MLTILDVNYWGGGGGGAEPWRNKADKFAWKFRWKNSPRNSPAILLKFTRPKLKFSPNLLCRTSGSIKGGVVLWMWIHSRCLRLLEFGRACLHFGSSFTEPEICVCLCLRTILCVRVRLYWERPECVCIENAPTCYRAPKWPDPELLRKMPKNTPRPEILDSQNFAPKIPPKYQKCAFLVFFLVFLGCFLGVPEFRSGGYFFGIFRGNSGLGHLGAL